MASEIRVNTINNSSGLGTITISDTGAVFAGVTTITNLQVNGTTTGVVMTGVTTVSTGSTSAPSITPSGDTNTGIFFPSADTIAFAEGGSEAARIDSSGRLLVGTSTSRGVAGGFDCPLQVASNDNAKSGLSIFRYVSNAVGIPFAFAKSRSDTLGSHTILQSGDTIADITWSGSDGSSFIRSAGISAQVDGTPGANDMPGRLVFSTTADGASSPTERMRIDSSGRMGLGTTSPSSQFSVGAGAGGTPKISLDYTVDNTSVASISASHNTGEVKYNAVTGYFPTFYSGNSERARIDTSGRLLVGTSTAISNVYVKAGQVSASATTPNQQFADTSNVYSGLSITKYSTAGYAGTLSLNTANSSSVGTNGAVANNWTTGVITFNGNDGTNFIPTAEIQAMVDGTPGSNDMPGRLVFSTTADGASSPTERMRITNQGYVAIGAKISDTSGGNGVFFHGGAGSSYLKGDVSSDFTLHVRNDSANPRGIRIQSYGISSGNTNNFPLYYDDLGSARFYFYTNGGLANVQANNVNLCDEREKNSIADLDSTWDCLKSWELKKFHYNGDADTDDLRYGVIAQQIAEHCPEVITEWVKQAAQPVKLDDEGNEIEPAKEEIVRMGVKEQQMMWMAIKALQESQTRIETLEAKVAALEAP